MEKKDEIQQLKSQLAASKKEVKSLNSKLKRSQAKVATQKVALKKKETKTIEVSDEQLQLLSSQLPGIDIKNLLFD